MDGYEEIAVGAMSYGGRGVGRLEDGRVVFIEGALPGERVVARLLAEHAHSAEARVEELLESSPDRVEARCPYHGRCGGCGLQHASYDAQLRYKRGFVVDAFERIGAIAKAEALVAPTLPSPELWGYRNKVELRPC
ncbi:MAG: TRAM domain-containing protein, partial [Coriobacteriales bacterium]|nr:TRAM domain-containing protein [Coriobacteriales bacterium]